MAGPSNYPNGFRHGIVIRGLPLTVTHPGEVFWVNNSSVLAKGAIGGSDTNPGTYQKPKSTIAGAISAATASRGDIVMVMPGHAENVSSDGGLALSKAGVAVIGLGNGSLRPTLTLDTAAAAAITVSAANVTLHNFKIVANFADITNAIDVTAKNCTLSYIDFSEAAANMNVLDWVACTSTSDNNADGLCMDHCVGYGIDAAVNSPLLINADLKDLVFTNNRFNTDHANALAMIQCATGKDLNNCYVAHNHYASLKTAGDILIDNDTTANDGFVAHNNAIHATTTAEVLCDADGVGLFENRGTGVVTASGYVLPAIDS